MWCAKEEVCCIIALLIARVFLLALIAEEDEHGVLFCLVGIFFFNVM